MIRDSRVIGWISSSVWVLFILAWILRAAFVAYHAHIGWQLRHDPSYYLTLAENLRHGVYSLFHPLDIPDTTHMPGYPFLLFLVRGDVLSMLMMQAVLSAAKVPLIHAIALRLGLAKRWALAAALLMALEPLDILFTGQVLTESSFTVLLLAGLWFWLKQDSWRSTLLTALCFASVSWLRPNGVIMLCSTAVLGILLLRYRWDRALAMASAGVLLLLPWVFHQHRMTGRWILGDGGVVAVAYFHLPDVLGRVDSAAARTYKDELNRRAMSTDWEDPVSSAAFYQGLRADIKQVLRKHPIEWAIAQSTKTARILVAPGRGHLTAFFRRRPIVLSAALAFSAAFALLTLLALAIVALRARRLPRPLVALLLLASLLLLTGGLSTADARFKVPAMPILILAVAWAGQSIALSGCRVLAGSLQHRPSDAQSTWRR